MILSDAIVGHLRERIDPPDPSTVLDHQSQDDDQAFPTSMRLLARLTRTVFLGFAERGDPPIVINMCSNVHTE